MKRMQLFEFEDFPWFPNVLRQSLMLYLKMFHRIFNTAEYIAPRVAVALKAGNTNQIVDLCSGGGGPMVGVGRRLRDDYKLPVQIRLTDLYPSSAGAATIDDDARSWTTYDMNSINAADVPKHLTGVRTMMCSFHHMPVTVAKGILRDAFSSKQPICIFELSTNNQPKWLWWTAFPVGIILVLFLTPFVRPLTFSQLFFTYVIPVLPIVIAWDGATSNARTYTPDDFRELTADLQAPDYKWEIQTFPVPKNPGPMMIVLGLPVKG